MQNQLLQAALEYARKGWRILPLGTGTREKLPRIKEWQHEASTDEEKISEWWRRWPDAGIGVAMGSGSGIIDIDCDSEEARQTLIKVIGEGGTFTPSFKSRRGCHYLFQFQEDLPSQANKSIDGEEIDLKMGSEGKGSYSVFPPTSGRTWVTDHSEDVETLPEPLYAWIWNQCSAGGSGATENGYAPKKDTKHWESMLGIGEDSGRNTAIASYAGRMLGSVADLDDQSEVDLARMSVHLLNKTFRPPLVDSEVDQTFESIWKSEVRGRVKALTAGVGPVQTSGRLEPAQDGEYSLVRIDSKPLVWELHHPMFIGRSPGGFVKLNTEQLTVPIAIQRAIIEQAHKGLNDTFVKIWKKENMTAKLVNSATVKDAPAEIHRDKVIASRLLEQIELCVDFRSDDALSADGVPTRLPGGEMIFSFSLVWGQMSMPPDKVSRNELSDVLTRVGCKVYRPRVKTGVRPRYKILDAQAQACLLDMLADGQEELSPVNASAAADATH